MSYKLITRDSYQATANEFTQNVANLAPQQSIEKFIQLLPPQATCIDIGCGSGRDAKIFSDKGINVLGIDFCANLIDIAKSNAPTANFMLMDIESMTFPAGSFDGVWAGCSLSHIPKKELPQVLNNIYLILKNNGSCYITLKKGSGEIFEKDSRYEGDFKKFWSLFEENEIRNLLEEANFKILELTTVEKKFAYQSHPSIRIFCKK